MPLEFAADLLLAILDLVRMSLIIAIPAFPIVLLCRKLHKRLSEKFGLNWILASFASAFAALTPIVFALYLVPLLMGIAATPETASLPEFMQLTILDQAMAFISTIVKNLLTILLFAILAMPLVFFASFLEEKLKEMVKVPELAQTFIAVFATTVLAWIILLYFSWILPAMIWKLYWSPI